MTGTGFIANDIGACVYCTPTQTVRIVESFGTPIRISATHAYFRKATLLGKNALDGTNNTGNVMVGVSANGQEQPYTIAPGDEVVLEAPVGAKWSLYDWYIDSLNNDDGVVIIYS